VPGSECWVALTRETRTPEPILDSSQKCKAVPRQLFVTTKS